MSYQVIKKFRDLQDKEYRYKAGDTYPREGYKPSQTRIDELASNQNKQKTPLIKKVGSEDTEQAVNSNFPKHTGGGWYKLSNGEKVKGKEAAQKAESELKE